MRRNAFSHALPHAVLLLLAAVPFGCTEGTSEWKNPFTKKELPPEAPPPKEEKITIALADTIGSSTALSGMGGLQVRGYSLVTGLVDQGSTECPAPLREYLIDYLTKTYKLRAGGEKGPDFSAPKMIDSPDTAVVEVVGFIPPGAPKGTQFDIAVEAVAGTQTRSLEGGMLWPCELKIVDVSYTGDKLLAGRTIAQARGPIFTNPFTAGDSATAADPRRGTVLGGGRSIENRNIRLALASPSYSLSRRIEQRINERFGHAPKTAEAMSQGEVEVRTPPAYADDPVRFVRLASHLFLHNEPQFFERKLNELAVALESPQADYEDIALLWEGVGRIAIPRIQSLYAHSNPSVRFYSARTGLRLGDAAALAVVGQIAADSSASHQEMAVRELGKCTFAQAASMLTPLLSADNQQIRIAAYESLLKSQSPVIHTRRIRSILDPNEVNLYLDTVECSGKPLVYVRRTGSPRVAVFGAAMPCRLPLFYSHPDGWLTLNAVGDSDEITMFRRTRRTNRLSDSLTVAPRVVDLIQSMSELPVADESGRTRGIGLTYSQVVSVLDALGRDETLPGRLVMQQPSMNELLGPDVMAERPEADPTEADTPVLTTPADSKKKEPAPIGADSR